MVVVLIPVVLIVVVVVVVLVTRKGGGGASEPTQWPEPTTTRREPTSFADMPKDTTRVTPTPARPRSAEPEVARPEPAAPEPEPPAPVAVPAPAPQQSVPQPEPEPDPEPEPEPEPEPDLSRFGVASGPKPDTPVVEMPKVQMRHLEGAPAESSSAISEPEPEAPSEPEPEPESPLEELGPEFEPVVVIESLDPPVDVPPVETPPVEVAAAEASRAEVEDVLDLDALDGADALAEVDAADDQPTADEPADDEPADDVAEVDDAARDAVSVALGGDQVRSDSQAELDRVIDAIIDRARATDQSVAEVATELVSRSQSDEHGVATLPGLVDEDGELVNIADRLSELTLFNDSVPTKPGALTQFMDLDAATRKRVIVRVLCLLVAKSEAEMKALPREPASEAETRQWPLARARWPVSSGDRAARDDVQPDVGVTR